jgi:hypothetical protein
VSVPLRRAVESHLGSRDVARIIYGAIVGLAVVAAVEAHPPSSGAMAATVFGTAVAVGLAELYGEFVATEARTRRRVDAPGLRQMAADGTAVMVGAGFPACFFVLAAAGVLTEDTAFTLAKWTGAALICGYAFLAARLAGDSVPRSLVHSAGLGAIAVALIALKALLH